MTKFFEKPAGCQWILGCDPGPEHSAFALVDCIGTPKVTALCYAPNDEIGWSAPQDFPNLLSGWSGMDFSPVAKPGLVFAFERCAVQSGGANSLVFETCMTAGEIRYLVGRNPCAALHSFAPSEWRYVLTGQACAKDANVRHLLLTLDPECDILVRSYSTKAKKMLELRKPITSHLRDAIGVAYACGFVRFRKGLELSQFPARLEVHCG